MGTESVEIKVVGSVSRHNSWRDRAHDAAWEAFREALDDLIECPEFKPLRLMIV